MDFGHHAENVGQAVWGCTREQGGLVRKESEPRRQRTVGKRIRESIDELRLRLVVDKNNLRCNVVIELCDRILSVTSVTTKNILRVFHSACLEKFWCIHLKSSTFFRSVIRIVTSSNFTHNQQRWYGA